jgi:hypothetical protein
MTDRFDALALPPRDPYPAVPYGPGYGFGPPSAEPPALLRVARRFWKLLLVLTVLSLGTAYVAGRVLGKPLWQAEATLLYQPIAFTEKQKAAYEHPPSLPTLAAWVREPELLRKLIDDFHLAAGEDDLATRTLKVEQPAATESIVVSFKWPDRDVANAALARLLDLFSDYVVTTRKVAILSRIESLDRQAAVACEDDIRRLDAQIVVLQKKLDQQGKLGDDDLDGSMLARQSLLKEDIRRLGQKLTEMNSELRFKRADYLTLKPVVEQAAEARIKLEVLGQQIEQLELQTKHTQESIDAAAEELRTLPIVLAKSKRHELVNKLEWLKEQLKEHAAAMTAANRPGGPPARGALEGMDAREFSVKSPPRVGDKPASSTTKTVFAGTFLGLMAAAFALLLVHDRRHPVPGRPIVYPRVHVTPPPVGPNGVDARRLAEWAQTDRRPIVTPPPVILDQDGRIEQPPPVETDPELLAARMQTWLGEGQGPGRGDEHPQDEEPVVKVAPAEPPRFQK